MSQLGVELLNTDCLDVLKWVEDDSIDAVITDPPAGINFMGKDWDSNKGGRSTWVGWLTEVMKECLRVLKPGAHALVWAIPRTSHWTGTAIEDAGFEVRDVVTHLFGSGFPKSRDISKDIDKAAGTEGKTTMDITAPSTDAAKKWDGFGTALKPAAEFWFLCRKPISEKTIAANMLKFGTGGLNIDASRIATAQSDPNIRVNPTKSNGLNSVFGIGDVPYGRGPNTQGRFPANLVLSCCGNEQHDLDCAVGMLDEQSGMRVSGGGSKGKRGGIFGDGSDNPNRANSLYFDTGGASRFFYVAKASAKDKGEFNSHPTVKSTKLMSYLIKLITPPGGIVLDPFMGSGSTGIAAIREGFKFIGIEKELKYYKIAQARLNDRH